jgi:hypothetical protein
MDFLLLTRRRQRHSLPAAAIWKVNAVSSDPLIRACASGLSDHGARLTPDIGGAATTVAGPQMTVFTAGG